MKTVPKYVRIKIPTHNTAPKKSYTNTNITNKKRNKMLVQKETTAKC
jgi:hypothetical protein